MHLQRSCAVTSPDQREDKIPAGWLRQKQRLTNRLCDSGYAGGFYTSTLDEIVTIRRKLQLA